MALYRVTLFRTESYETKIDVEADSVEAAKEAAWEIAHDTEYELLGMDDEFGPIDEITREEANLGG